MCRSRIFHLGTTTTSMRKTRGRQSFNVKTMLIDDSLHGPISFGKKTSEELKWKHEQKFIILQSTKLITISPHCKWIKSRQNQQKFQVSASNIDTVCNHLSITTSSVLVQNNTLIWPDTALSVPSHWFSCAAISEAIKKKYIKLKQMIKTSNKNKKTKPHRHTHTT